MDFSTSALISKLIGSVSISELKLAPLIKEPSGNNWYLVYGTTENTDLRKISELDLYNYLVSRIFFIMVGKNKSGLCDLSGIDAILSSLDKKTPVTLGRYLNDNKLEWIEFTKNGARTTIGDIFLPKFQYAYLENTSKQKPTMLLRYEKWTYSQNEVDGYNSTYNNDGMSSRMYALDICPCQWDTHLPPPPNKNEWNWKTDKIEIKHFLHTNEIDGITYYIGKGLIAPFSSLAINSNGKPIFERYQNRNYNQIVNGNGKNESGIQNDIKWGGADVVRADDGRTESTIDENEVKEIDKDGHVEIDRIGDIDATLNAIMEYLDDWEEENDFKKHTFRGMVVITTNKANLTDFSVDDTFKYDNETSGLSWNENIFNGKFIRASSSAHSTGGTDAVRLTENQIPKHHHNTVKIKDKTDTHNISVMGNPEGESIGGVVVTDRAQKTNTGNVPGPEDEVQTMQNIIYISQDPNGPYSGGLRYQRHAGKTGDPLPEQLPHENLPLFYNVRILVRV